MLTLQSTKSNILTTILRIGLVLLVFLYVIPTVAEYFATYELTVGIILNMGVALLFIAAGVFNLFGIDGSVKVALNSDFLRSDEGSSYIRTAYWNKVKTLTLTRFGIRIKYQSGTPERFRLPYLSSKEFGELNDRLQQISQTHDIEYIQKPWWKPF